MDVVVKVLEPADSQALMSVEDLKIMLGLPAAPDPVKDPQLQMFIDQQSAVIANLVDRDFAREKVRETWRCVPPVCCPNGVNRVYLRHFPVAEADIESVESPAGTVLDPADYELEEETGKLQVFANATSEIVITYTGGYELPDGAPDDLQLAVGMLSREMRNEIGRDATVGAGVKMLGHKESRVIYFAPKDLVVNAGSATSPTQAAIKNLLSHYTAYWM